MNKKLELCASHSLQERGLAVPFDVIYGGQTCRAFAIRFDGVVYAYLNRCSHVAMEMDFQPDRFFDASRQWLVCATHGATYAPETGECQGGPCRAGLIKIQTSEQNGQVYWHTDWNLQPVELLDV